MANEGIKFLIWAYFNLGVDEDCDVIIKKCIDKAYIDATNQGAFNTIAANVARLSSADSHMFSAIKRIQIGRYDSWHKMICVQIVNDYSSVKNKKNGTSAFTYGNSQKWVNMTVKYLYIFRSLMSELGDVYSKDFCTFYDNRFLTFERDYHIPIDSFIMEAIWPQKGVHSWIPNPQYLKSGNLGKYSSSKHKPWSQFDNIDYDKVKKYAQSIIPSNTLPLEWENANWIKVAKSRKK